MREAREGSATSWQRPVRLHMVGEMGRARHSSSCIDKKTKSDAKNTSCQIVDRCCVQYRKCKACHIRTPQRTDLMNHLRRVAQQRRGSLQGHAVPAYHRPTWSQPAQPPVCTIIPTNPSPNLNSTTKQFKVKQVGKFHEKHFLHESYD